MTTADLFLTLRGLSRAEKLKVMQFLIAELGKEEEPTLLYPSKDYQKSSNILDWRSPYVV